MSRPRTKDNQLSALFINRIKYWFGGDLGRAKNDLGFTEWNFNRWYRAMQARLIPEVDAILIEQALIDWAERRETTYLQRTPDELIQELKDSAIESGFLKEPDEYKPQPYANYYQLTPLFSGKINEWFKTKSYAKHSLGMTDERPGQNLREWSDAKFNRLIDGDYGPIVAIIKLEQALIMWAKLNGKDEETLKELEICATPFDRTKRLAVGPTRKGIKVGRTAAKHSGHIEK